MRKSASDKKASFVLYQEQWAVFDKLTTSQRGELITLIFAWQRSDDDSRKEIAAADAVIQFALSLITEQITNDELKYKITCEKNRENARKRPVATGSDRTINHDYIYNLLTSSSRIEVGRFSGAREDWRSLSSVCKDSLGWNKDAIAEFKAGLLRQEVEDSGMLTPAGVDAFMAKWGEHSPGDERIRAEFEPTFNVTERAKNYVSIGRQVDANGNAVVTLKTMRDKFKPGYYKEADFNENELTWIRQNVYHAWRGLRKGNYARVVDKPYFMDDDENIKTTE